MERKYMMYEGENGNTIDPLYETPTTFENGVKVIVPVNYSDTSSFISKIKEQLAYFEDVYYDVYSGVYNNFKIFRGDEFQYSENSADTNLHICLDNVYYPIDFNKLGINRIEVPVGLRCTLKDGIFPTPNRESIRYTIEAKEIILKKIKSLADYFITKYNADVTSTKDINEIFKYYSNKRREVHIAEDVGRVFDVSTFSSFSDIQITTPKLEGVELLDLERVYEKKSDLLGEYKIKFEANSFRIKELNRRKSSDVSISDVNNNKKFLLYEATMGVNKKEYLKSTLPGYETSYLIKKTDSYRLGFRQYIGMYEESYYKLLKLKKYPKDQWRTVIKEFQFIQSQFTSKFIDVDSIEVPQAWLDARKKKRLSMSQGGNRRMKLQGELSCKIAAPLERFVAGKSCKFVAETLKYEDLHKIGALIVYDTHENSDKLDKLYEITHALKLKCITFSDREIKNIEKLGIHNLISYKKFMEGDNKPFKRLVTSYLIKELMSEQSGVFDSSFHLKTLSTDLVNKIESLKNYRNKHYIRNDSTIYEAMFKVAEEHNLFDMEIYSTYTEVRDFLKKLPFVNILVSEMDRYEREKENDKDKALTGILCDMLKYYKIRIDYTNYNITLNDTTWMDEVLTDETIEDLLDDPIEEEELIEEEEV